MVLLSVPAGQALPLLGHPHSISGSECLVEHSKTLGIAVPSCRVQQPVKADVQSLRLH